MWTPSEAAEVADAMIEARYGVLSRRGCLAIQSLQDNIVYCVSGETKNGMTGASVSYHVL